MTARAYVLEAAVDGDPALLYSLVGSLEGHGFLDWPDVAPSRGAERTAALLLRPGKLGGACDADEARHVASQIAWRLTQRIERERRRIENGAVLPFDLQSIKPVPREVVHAGYGGGGQAWLLENWGVPTPVWRVNLEMGTRILETPRTRGRPRAGARPAAWTRTQAVYSFMSEGFPWPCFRRLLRDWPDIEFRVRFDDEFGAFDKTWAPVVADRVSEPDLAAALA